MSMTDLYRGRRVRISVYRSIPGSAKIGFGIGGYDGGAAYFHLGIVWHLFVAVRLDRVRAISECREFMFSISGNGLICLKTWTAYHDGREYAFSVPNFFLGRELVDFETLDWGSTKIPMPERNYPAQYRIRRRSSKRALWFNRTEELVEFTMRNSIPIVTDPRRHKV